MGLKDDIEAMERHSQNGTLKQWFQGTAPPLPPEPWPLDRSAGDRRMGDAEWMRERGD